LQSSGGEVDAIIQNGDEPGLDPDLSSSSVYIELQNFSGRSEKDRVKGSMNDGEFLFICVLQEEVLRCSMRSKRNWPEVIRWSYFSTLSGIVQCDGPLLSLIFIYKTQTTLVI